MKLADTLLASYTSSVAAYPEDAWTVQCGVGTEQDIKVMYKAQNESSSNAIVCASASFVLPMHMRKAFDLLKNNLLRVKVRPGEPALSPSSSGHLTWQQQHNPLSLLTLLPMGGGGSGTSW